MKKLFPEMYDRPDTSLVIATFVYWFLCYAFVPFGLVLLSVGLPDDTVVLYRAWLEVGYHLVNGVLAVLIMRSYLRDSFYNVQLHAGRFFKTVAAACAVMLASAAACFGVMCVMGSADRFFFALPVFDQNIFLNTGNTVSTLPIPGALCASLLTPLAVSCLFYAPGFAVSASKKPWLGYLTVTLLFGAFHLFEYFWHLDFSSALLLFLVRLPVHLIACWSYQKANTVWAPIVSLGVFNLVTALAAIAFA